MKERLRNALTKFGKAITSPKAENIFVVAISALFVWWSLEAWSEGSRSGMFVGFWGMLMWAFERRLHQSNDKLFWEMAKNADEAVKGWGNAIETNDRLLEQLKQQQSVPPQVNGQWVN